MQVIHTKKGFTLIELLVVIAIIGILAAIGITAFSGAQAKARDSKRRADLGNLATALVIYVDKNLTYPGVAAVGTPELVSAGLATASADTSVGFSLPKCPSCTAGSNNDYWYVRGTATTAGDLAALFTQLEQYANTAAVWFVSNSRGFSGDVPDQNAAGAEIGCVGACLAPAAASTECVLTAGGDAYSPCLPNPIMNDNA